MTSVSQQHPVSPQQASRKKAPVDQLLDPALFKVLGEPTRARLFACLVKCNRRCSVTEVAACCSIDFSVVARHLSAMARDGVLTAEKEGRTVWYEARTAALAIHFRTLADELESWRKCDADCGCPSNESCC